MSRWRDRPAQERRVRLMRPRRTTQRSRGEREGACPATPSGLRESTARPRGSRSCSLLGPVFLGLLPFLVAGVGPRLDRRLGLPTPQDRTSEPHRRRASDGPGILPRLLVGQHPADSGPGYATAGDAHPGAVDRGSVPLLPQSDDAGDHPGLPGHRRSPRGRSRARSSSSPWPPPCWSTSSASRRGSWPRGSARPTWRTSERRPSSSRGFRDGGDHGRAASVRPALAVGRLTAHRCGRA